MRGCGTYEELSTDADLLHDEQLRHGLVHIIHGDDVVVAHLAKNFNLEAKLLHAETTRTDAQQKQQQQQQCHGEQETNELRLHADLRSVASFLPTALSHTHEA